MKFAYVLSTEINNEAIVVEFYLLVEYSTVGNSMTTETKVNQETLATKTLNADMKLLCYMHNLMMLTVTAKPG